MYSSKPSSSSDAAFAHVSNNKAYKDLVLAPRAAASSTEHAIKQQHTIFGSAHDLTESSHQFTYGAYTKYLKASAADSHKLYSTNFTPRGPYLQYKMNEEDNNHKRFNHLANHQLHNQTGVPEPAKGDFLGLKRMPRAKILSTGSSTDVSYGGYSDNVVGI